MVRRHKFTKKAQPKLAWPEVVYDLGIKPSTSLKGAWLCLPLLQSSPTLQLCSCVPSQRLSICWYFNPISSEMLSLLHNDLHLFFCTDFCAVQIFARWQTAAVGLQNSKVWKELTRAGKKQEMKVYLNSKVHRRVEKNKMGFCQISYRKARMSIN